MKLTYCNDRSCVSTAFSGPTMLVVGVSLGVLLIWEKSRNLMRRALKNKSWTDGFYVRNVPMRDRSYTRRPRAKRSNSTHGLMLAEDVTIFRAYKPRASTLRASWYSTQSNFSVYLVVKILKVKITLKCDYVIHVNCE